MQLNNLNIAVLGGGKKRTRRGAPRHEAWRTGMRV